MQTLSTLPTQILDILRDSYEFNHVLDIKNQMPVPNQTQIQFDKQLDDLHNEYIFLLKCPFDHEQQWDNPFPNEPQYIGDYLVEYTPTTTNNHYFLLITFCK